MTGRERLLATLNGKPVDRPAVSFYEIGGLDFHASDDNFNVHNDPSWVPLLELAEEKTDLIRMRAPRRVKALGNSREEFFKVNRDEADGSRFTRTTVKIAGRTLSSVNRQDRDVDTTWHLEHLLKNSSDLLAYLELPDDTFVYEPDVTALIQAEEEVADKGIVMVDSADPICQAAELFSMKDYLVLAFSERQLFHRLLDKLARPLHEFTEKVAKAFPGHLWRICGAEYAGEPYLPPELFKEYVIRYTEPMVKGIQKYGGFARLHMHGRIRSALPMLAQMGIDGLYPIEPAPQGDVDLSYVRQEYGRDIALFGNIESSDLENMAPSQFEAVVAKSLADGTMGSGRGFVLMPSSCPYGRDITPLTLANYRTMVRMATSFGA